MLTALAGIRTAVAVFPVIRRQSEAASLGFVTTRSYEAAVLIIGVLALVTIVSLRQAGPAEGTDDRRWSPSARRWLRSATKPPTSDPASPLP